MTTDKEQDRKAQSGGDGHENDVGEGHELITYIDPVKESKMMRKFDVRQHSSHPQSVLIHVVADMGCRQPRYPVYASKSGQVRRARSQQLLSIRQ